MAAKVNALSDELNQFADGIDNYVGGRNGASLCPTRCTMTINIKCESSE